MHYFFVDFDETLFNHRAYVDWLSKYIEETRGVDSSSYTSTFDEYHDVQDQDGLLRLYRHAEHLFDKTGLRWESLSAEIEEQIIKQNKDFCYDDAHKFMSDLSAVKSHSLRLLTYGDESYQRYKIGLCRHISKHPVHVTTIAKSTFLSNYFGGSGDRGLLVDDKTPLNLPDNWKHIWINRHGLQKAKPGNHLEVAALDAASILQQTSFADTIIK